MLIGRTMSRHCLAGNYPKVHKPTASCEAGIIVPEVAPWAVLKHMLTLCQTVKRLKTRRTHKVDSSGSFLELSGRSTFYFGRWLLERSQKHLPRTVPEGPVQWWTFSSGLRVHQVHIGEHWTLGTQQHTGKLAQFGWESKQLVTCPRLRNSNCTWRFYSSS